MLNTNSLPNFSIATLEGETRGRGEGVCIKPPKENTPEYFQSQSRDMNLVGFWDVVTGNKDRAAVIEFTTNGKMIFAFPEGVGKTRNEYYYTKGNVLYRLLVGDGFKVSNSVITYEYKLEENNTQLYLRSVGG